MSADPCIEAMQGLLEGLPDEVTISTSHANVLVLHLAHVSVLNMCQSPAVIVTGVMAHHLLDEALFNSICGNLLSDYAPGRPVPDRVVTITIDGCAFGDCFASLAAVRHMQRENVVDLGPSAPEAIITAFNAFVQFLAFQNPEAPKIIENYMNTIVIQ